jgi:nucleoside-diphosphate-sugar epimerase
MHIEYCLAWIIPINLLLSGTEENVLLSSFYMLLHIIIPRFTPEIMLTKNDSARFFEISIVGYLLLTAFVAYKLLERGSWYNIIQLSFLTSYGAMAAHYFIHYNDYKYTFLAQLQASFMGMPRYIVDHRRHHKDVGTAMDSATSPKNKLFISYFMQRLIYSHYDSLISDPNTYLFGELIHACLLCSIYVAFGVKGASIFVIQGFLAVLMLESMNYIWHYGCTKYTTIAWDSKAFNKYFIWNTKVHTMHHENASIKCNDLQTSDNQMLFPLFDSDLFIHMVLAVSHTNYFFHSMNNTLRTEIVAEPIVVPDKILTRTSAKQTQNVVIIGASGYIGSSILNELITKNYNIHCSINKTPIVHDKATMFYLSIDDSQEIWDNALRDCDVCIFAAGCFPIKCPRDVSRYMIDPYLTGIRRCMTSCLLNGVQSLIFISSFAACAGSVKEHAFINEESYNNLSDQWSDPYKYSKSVIEKHVNAWYNGIELDNKFNLFVLCPATVVGKKTNASINTATYIIDAVMSGEYVLTCDSSLPYVHINDIVEVNRKLIVKGEKLRGHYERIILYEKSLSFGELLQLLKDNDFKPKQYDILFPNWILRTISLFDTRLLPLLPDLGQGEYNVDNRSGRKYLDNGYSSVEKGIIEYKQNT